MSTVGDIFQEVSCIMEEGAYLYRKVRVQQTGGCEGEIIMKSLIVLKTVR